MTRQELKEIRELKAKVDRNFWAIERNFMFMMFIFSMFFNIVVMSANDWKMPVLTDDFIISNTSNTYFYTNGGHFTYTESEKRNITFWELSDIYHLGNICIFSIGDLGMVISIIGIIYYMLILPIILPLVKIAYKFIRKRRLFFTIFHFQIP
jgi:hypothetical protein